MLNQFLENNKDLPISLREIVCASNNISVANYSSNDLTNKLLVLIAKTHLNCGIQFDEHSKQLTDLTVDDLCKDIQKKFISLTFEEIELAFSNGYQKQYGKFFGLNNATYFHWITSFLESEQVLKVKKMIVLFRQKPIDEPKLSPEEIDNRMIDYAIQAFEHFKNGNSYYINAGIYNILEKRDLLKLTLDRKKQIMNQAKVIVKNEIIENKGTKTIEQAIASISGEIVVIRAKKMAVIEYFNGLIELNEELNELLTKKQ